MFIEYNKRNKKFVFKNDNDYLIENIDLFLSYYDKKGKLISYENKEIDKLGGGGFVDFLWNAPDYKIVKVKAFAWERNSLTPLGNAVEISVNTPSKPDKDMSVFKNGDVKAIINCEEIVLNEAPKVIDDTMYISYNDLEKLGHKTEVSGNKRYVYIENGELEYEFAVGEYTIRRYYPDNSFEKVEISAPVIDDNGIKVPLNVLFELFEERLDWHSDTGMLFLNLPFKNIEECGEYAEAVMGMYYRGVVDGTSEGRIEPKQDVLRCEAAVYFTRTMGYEFYDYKFECSDVTSDHWAKSFIGICVNENVFELEDNKFRPLEYITVEKTIIAALKMIGEDTDNYLQTAKETGLMTNIKQENMQRNITRAELFQILYNAVKLYD